MARCAKANVMCVPRDEGLPLLRLYYSRYEFTGIPETRMACHRMDIFTLFNLPVCIW